MKQLLLLFFVLPILGFSQCPGVFTSQAQIDAFATDFPDCTVIDGFFVISGEDITDLSGLAQIEQCQGLGIGGNPLLQDLTGLNPNIVFYYVEGTGTSLGISNNASLVSIDGLQNLVSNSGFESNLIVRDNPLLSSLVGLPNNFNALNLLYIINNDSLTNMIGIGDNSGSQITEISDNDGLIDLTGMGNFYAETLQISNNSSLQSLNGSELGLFEDYLLIENNPSLTDISAIYAGSYNNDGLIIRNNASLSICSTAPVCFFLNSKGIEEGIWFPGIFENNAPGCSTNFEIEYGCGIVTNDDCGLYNYPSRYLILGETIQANNEYATTSLEAPSCDEISNRQDLWFVVDSGENTTLDIITDAGFSLQLWDSNTGTYPECGFQTQVANACGGSQLLDIPVIPNTFYIIQIWSDDSGRRASGWFNLTVQDGALSVSEIALSDVKIFPNPTSDILYIKSGARVDKVTIYNMLGQNVHESTFYTNDVSVNISNLNGGMYTAIVSSDGKESTYKIIKQ